MTESGLFGLAAPYIGSLAVKMNEYKPTSAKSLAEISTAEFATIYAHEVAVVSSYVKVAPHRGLYVTENGIKAAASILSM